MRVSKLDGLRGIFSFMIVLFHYDPRIIPNFVVENFIIRESWIFVEFFFVLSGYVISYNYINIITKTDLKRFMLKRFIRLYPLLLFTTLLFLIFESFSNLFLINIINTPESISSLLVKTFDTLLLTNSTPILGNSSGMNGPSWSISAEMISYLIFGLIVFMSKANYRSLIFLTIIFLSGFFYLTKTPGLDLDFLRGTISFSLGVILYYVNKFQFRLNKHFELFIPLGLLLSMYLINLKTENYAIHRTVTINFVFFISIGILLKTSGVISRLLENSLFQYLGKISYSIYLNHLIIITIIPRLFFSILKIDQSVFSQFFVMIISIIITLIYSNITYNKIEVNAGNFLKSKFLN